MSKRNQALSAARGAAKAAGGAHLTKQARMGTLQRLFQWLHENGFQVSGVDSLRERHIASYISARKDDGARVRTLQNEASHIRGAMRAEGRHQAADSATISNKALGSTAVPARAPKSPPLRISTRPRSSWHPPWTRG